MKGKIAEVFESFQGEGLYLGERQLFVRFFGCNLSCKFCDTKLNKFVEYSPQELLLELKKYNEDYHSVAFTGGEPLLQKDFLKEAAALTHSHGFKNYLETNGTLAAALEEVIDLFDIVAMDIKLPSSTSLDGFWQEHRRFLEVAKRKEIFLKMVICESTEEGDLLRAVELIKTTHHSAVLILQPNSYEDFDNLAPKLEKFKAVATQNSITACIIAQIHKIMGLR